MEFAGSRVNVLVIPVFPGISIMDKALLLPSLSCSFIVGEQLQLFDLNGIFFVITINSSRLDYSCTILGQICMLFGTYVSISDKLCQR
jgi:hypothetical protein